MLSHREKVLQDNFTYFQGIVAGLMSDHAGKYALLHSQSLVALFPKPIDALAAGYERFADGIFSVQKVIDRPLDLGFMSYGAGDRPAE